MNGRLPETSIPPPPALPAAQIALEAYWHVGRHLRVYASQILVLSVICGFVQFATYFVVAIVVAGAGAGTQTAALNLALVVTIVTVLLLGGTAIFIDSQRAIVLGLPPAVGHALRLRPGETRVLRAVCVYWLIVHLVPTFVVQMSYLAPFLQFDWPLRLPMPANFAFYWAWVLATVPLVVMSLPIVLFENAPAPLVEGRQRLDRNGGRMFIAGAIAFVPLGVVEIAIYALRDAAGSFADNPGMFLLVDLLIMSILQCMISLSTILVMSALVAAAYMRLSPRIESVYRVFD